MPAKYYIGTSGWSYEHWGKSSQDQLTEWSELVCQYLRQGKEVFAYFNNDAFGYALENAGELARLIAKRIKPGPV